VRSATNLMMIRTIEQVLARGTGLGQREVAGTLIHVKPPLTDEELTVGPQDIVYGASIDRSCLRVIQRAGGLITADPGLDSPGAMAAVELGIPAVIGVGDEINNLTPGEKVILDTTTGRVIKWNK
jgi:pyruvate kinase